VLEPAVSPVILKVAEPEEPLALAPVTEPFASDAETVDAPVTANDIIFNCDALVPVPEWLTVIMTLVPVVIVIDGPAVAKSVNEVLVVV
jgi:hypothetical protein